MINQELVDKRYGKMQFKLATPADVVKDYPIFKKFFTWLNFHGNTTLCLKSEASSQSNRYRILLYSDKYCYAIDVDKDTKHENPYIGCVYSCRKHEPLEDWTRGRDLTDGYGGKDTLMTILLEIIENELVGLRIDGYTPENTHTGDLFNEYNEE